MRIGFKTSHLAFGHTRKPAEPAKLNWIHVMVKGTVGLSRGWWLRGAGWRRWRPKRWLPLLRPAVTAPESERYGDRGRELSLGLGVQGALASLGSGGAIPSSPAGWQLTRATELGLRCPQRTRILEGQAWLAGEVHQAWFGGRTVAGSFARPQGSCRQALPLAGAHSWGRTRLRSLRSFLSPHCLLPRPHSGSSPWARRWRGWRSMQCPSRARGPGPRGLGVCLAVVGVPAAGSAWPPRPAPPHGASSAGAAPAVSSCHAAAGPLRLRVDFWPCAARPQGTSSCCARPASRACLLSFRRFRD